MNDRSKGMNDRSKEMSDRSKATTRPGRIDCELRTTLPATLEAIEEFMAEFRKRSDAMLDHVNCFAAELLVREALTNAVIHGCRTNPGKHVRCYLRLRGRNLLIAIKDEGDGFDWRALRNYAAPDSACSGRGIEILRQYASRLRFNEKGNLVAMVKRF